LDPTLNDLLFATATFVGGHFLLSSLPVRRPAVARLGEGPFRGLYSLAVGVAFAWMLLAYGQASDVPVWDAPAWTRWLPVVVMPFACILVVGSMTTRNVTLVGGDAITDGLRDPAPGIMRITRHPFLVGVLLWAFAHVPSNGDLASLILFGGLAVLAAGGMAHIDHRRREGMGSAWGPIALTTSVVPFAAILSRRTSFDWAGIGLWRVAAGLGLYVALLLLHPLIIGVSPIP